MRSLLAMLLAVPAFGTPTLTTYSNSDCTTSGNTGKLCDFNRCCSLGLDSNGNSLYYKITDIATCSQTGVATISVHNSLACVGEPITTVTSTTASTCKTVNGINFVMQANNLEFNKVVCRMQDSQESGAYLTMEMWMGPNCAGIAMTTTRTPLAGTTSKVNSVMKNAVAPASRKVQPLAVECPADVDAGMGQCSMEHDRDDDCLRTYKITEMTCNPQNQLHIATTQYSDERCTIKKGFLGMDAMATMSIPINGQCTNVMGGFFSMKAWTDSQLITDFCAIVNSDPALRSSLGYSEYNAFVLRNPVYNGVSSVIPTLSALVLLILAVMI